MHKPEKWPGTKHEGFWNSASEFVLTRGKGAMKRSGKYIEY